MAEETIQRVVAEAALARRLGSQIDERASKADIPALVEEVEVLVASEGGGTPSDAEIGYDTDGVPYLTTGE